MSRLALGAAQFGMAYGIGNVGGRVQPQAVRDILRQARAGGVDTIDTAIAYGNSEQVLGEVGVDGWNLVSKLPPLPEGVGDIEAWVRTEVQASMTRLGTRRLYGLLLHRPALLLGPHAAALQKAMRALQAEGKVGKTGVSIYGPDELDLLEGIAGIELIQSPLNILDRRIVDSGWLARLQSRGVEVHTRSAFLQGLLLMPASQRPPRFDRWAVHWQAWERWLERCGLTPLQACLRFALSIPGVSRVVVGVDGISHLEEILVAAAGAALPSLPVWPETPAEELINPSLWNLL